MSEMELIERASTKDEIRQALAELERQKPKNMEAFESREAEIRRLLDLFAHASDILRAH